MYSELVLALIYEKLFWALPKSTIGISACALSSETVLLPLMNRIMPATETLILSSWMSLLELYVATPAGIERIYSPNPWVFVLEMLSHMTVELGVLLIMMPVEKLYRLQFSNTEPGWSKSMPRLLEKLSPMID